MSIVCRAKGCMNPTDALIIEVDHLPDGWLSWTKDRITLEPHLTDGCMQSDVPEAAHEPDPLAKYSVVCL